MRSRAEHVRVLQEMFRIRARHELLAVTALASVGNIHWQDALDIFSDAMDEEMNAMLTGLRERERPKQ